MATGRLKGPMVAVKNFCLHALFVMRYYSSIELI